MANKVFIATTIDGNIARKNGDIDWLESIDNPDNNDFGYNDFISTIDAIVMGKNTFEKVLSFEKWPYLIPVYVLSKTLKEIPENLINNVKIINGNLKDIVDNLHNQGYKNIYIDGGMTIQSFLKENLIDEMIITIIPILIGKGIKLFGDLNDDLHLIHKNTTVFKNGLIQNHYIKQRTV